MSKDVRFVDCAAFGCAGICRLCECADTANHQNPDVPPTWIPDIKFASGREIVPYLEGWIKNPDGASISSSGTSIAIRSRSSSFPQVLRTLSCRADPTAGSRPTSLRNGSRECIACAFLRTGETKRSPGR